MERNLFKRLLRHHKDPSTISEENIPNVTDNGSVDIKRTTDDLNRKIENDLNELFPNPNMQTRNMENLRLDWHENMPQMNNDNPYFRDWDIVHVLMQKGPFSDTVTIGLLLGKTVGSVFLIYNNGFCKIETHHMNSIGEEIGIVEDSKNPIGNAVRLSRFS